jgi:hypothetical protein
VTFCKAEQILALQKIQLYFTYNSHKAKGKNDIVDTSDSYDSIESAKVMQKM